MKSLIGLVVVLGLGSPGDTISLSSPVDLQYVSPLHETYFVQPKQYILREEETSCVPNPKNSVNRLESYLARGKIGISSNSKTNLIFRRIPASNVRAGRFKGVRRS